MFYTEQHTMQLDKTHSSGAEEWHCPACSRRFVLQWAPYKKVVLEKGDEYAAHSGGKGGLQMGTPQITQSDSNESILSNDLRDALDGLDFDFGD
ncbi:MAG: hypothetical protein GY803_02085 [Chloroflexi bacterium]|nr:hypothetical protein [Chloroflexota bacterium]